MKLASCALAAVVSLSPLSSPAASSLTAEAEYASVDGEAGGEVGLGYRAVFGGLTVTPWAGVFVPDGDNSNVYGKLEVNYHISRFFELGARVRFGNGRVLPYGTLAIPVLPHALYIKGNLGLDYYSGGLAVRF